MNVDQPPVEVAPPQQAQTVQCTLAPGLAVGSDYKAVYADYYLPPHCIVFSPRAAEFIETPCIIGNVANSNNWLSADRHQVYGVTMDISLPDERAYENSNETLISLQISGACIIRVNRKDLANAVPGVLLQWLPEPLSVEMAGDVAGFRSARVVPVEFNNPELRVNYGCQRQFPSSLDSYIEMFVNIFNYTGYVNISPIINRDYFTILIYQTYSEAEYKKYFKSLVLFDQNRKVVSAYYVAYYLLTVCHYLDATAFDQSKYKAAKTTVATELDPTDVIFTAIKDVPHATIQLAFIICMALHLNYTLPTKSIDATIVKNAFAQYKSMSTEHRARYKTIMPSLEPSGAYSRVFARLLEWSPYSNGALVSLLLHKQWERN